MSNAYRSITTGDKGFMVEKAGKQYIRLDRANQQIDRLYKEREWIAEDEHRPLLPHQTGRVLFEAEKWLLMALALPEGRAMDWEFMSNEERNAWIQEESEFELVRKLHDQMNKVLGPLGE